MKKFLYFNFLAIILTYVSLLYQKNILVDRIVVDKLGEVEVIAGGFPLQFLIDGETSPVGSISINPLFIFIGMDQFVFLNFFIDYLFSSSHFAGKCSTDLEEEVVRVAVSIGHPLNDFDPVVHALQHAGVQPVEGTGNDTLHIWLQLLGKSYQSINSATEGHAGPFPPGASGRRLAFRKP